MTTTATSSVPDSGVLRDFTGPMTRERVLKHLRTKFAETQILPRTMLKIPDGIGAEGVRESECKCGHGSVRIMQWNILAQALANAEFVFCPSWALEWEWRAALILWEVMRFDPDVICIEEMDQFAYFEPLLTQLGYAGTFLPKVHSPCLDFAQNTGPDGCALFYRTTLLTSEHVLPLNLVDANGKCSNQVALCHVLQFRERQPECVCRCAFGVVLTHLKAKSGFSEQRQAQAVSLIAQVEEIARQHTIPIVLCGDMNAVPTEPAHTVIGQSRLGFRSAYCYLQSARVGSGADINEPAYTTWKVRANPDGSKREACQTIDYMYFSTGVYPIQLADIPDDATIGPNRLPCASYPSDHFALICDFKFSV